MIFVEVKMRKIILCLLIILILNIAVSSGEINWYDVEAWELEVCQKWGGTDEANSGISSGDSRNFLSQLTLTLQGEKVQFMIDDSTYTTQYRIGWYFVSIEKNYTYDVVLDAGSPKVLVDDEEASIFSGQSGFYAFYENNTEYDTVTLEYCEQDSSSCGKLTVPIVEG